MPFNQVASVSFSADIAIETALNKFEVINVDFNKG